MTMIGLKSETPRIATYEQAVNQATLEVEKTLNQLQTYKRDYEDLIHVLEDLPKKAKCPIMVPLGSLAFMPGHIVHTNEITVSLGDGWYVEQSASQAKEMVQRRIQDLNEDLSSHSKNLHSMQVRQKHIPLFDPKPLRDALLNEEGLPMLDICEPLDNKVKIRKETDDQTPSICFIPTDQKMILTAEQKNYLSSIFDHVSDNEEEESTFLEKKLMKHTTQSKIMENSSLKKKKVSFSNETLAYEAVKEKQQDFKDEEGSQKKKPISPLSDHVVERDTTLEDELHSKEDMELIVEYNEMLQAYHKQRNFLHKRHSSNEEEGEEEGTSPRFGKPFLPCSVNKKLELQSELSKLATSVASMKVQPRNETSNSPDNVPKKQSKFMQSRLSKQNLNK